MNLLGGLSPHLVAAHIAAVTAAVPPTRRRRRKRSNAGAWIACVVLVAILIRALWL